MHAIRTYKVIIFHDYHKNLQIKLKMYDNDVKLNFKMK